MKRDSFLKIGLLFAFTVTSAVRAQVQIQSLRGTIRGTSTVATPQPAPASPLSETDVQNLVSASQMIMEGRRTFRFDTFGDEAFWGDTLKLHQAIQGEKLGGVGPGLSPKAALDLGLKVDADA